MNSMARSVDADRDDLPGDLSSLYELMRRSTSAECGLAAKSRASATINAFQHSVLQTYTGTNLSDSILHAPSMASGPKPLDMT